MGDNIQIKLARKNGTLIAAMLNPGHQNYVVYACGCSDARFHRFVSMPFLFWRLVGECRASGAERVDFGHSDLDNEGLISFEDRPGTTGKSLTYYRHASAGMRVGANSQTSQGLWSLFSILRDAVLPTMGKVLYRHIG